CVTFGGFKIFLIMPDDVRCSALIDKSGKNVRQTELCRRRSTPRTGAQQIQLWNPVDGSQRNLCKRVIVRKIIFQPRNQFGNLLIGIGAKLLAAVLLQSVIGNRTSSCPSGTEINSSGK